MATQNTLIGSFSAILGILVIVSAFLIIGIITIAVLYHKQKKAASLSKKDVTPFRKYTNRLDGTLRASQEEPPSVVNNTIASTPSVNEQPGFTHSNSSHGKILPRAKKLLHDDMCACTSSSPVQFMFSRAHDFNVKSKHASPKTGACA